MALCDPCRRQYDDWLDYRPPRSVSLVAHATYDLTAAGVADRRRALTEERNSLVRRQRAAIRVNCAEGRHVQPKTEE